MLRDLHDRFVLSLNEIPRRKIGHLWMELAYNYNLTPLKQVMQRCFYYYFACIFKHDTFYLNTYNW